MSKSIKSVFDAMSDIESVLVSAGIPALITGEIRVASRKLGSAKEDVVINSLIYNADQKQSGIFNINVHVPNLKNQPAGNPTATDNTQPNTLRFSELGGVVSAALDDYRGFDFCLSLRSPGELENFGTEWLFNIQVRYQYLRIDV